MSSKIPRISGSNSNKSKLPQQQSSTKNTKPKSRPTDMTEEKCNDPKAKMKSKSKITNGKDLTSLTRSHKKPTTSFANGSQKTMSYTQLKQEVQVLQEQNGELRNKMSKHQNALHSSQKTTKHLQKENEDLQQHIVTSECDYKATIENKTEEWTSRNDRLAGRLSQCEVKLEELGMDPVSLDTLQDDNTLKQHRTKAAENARVLQQNLEHNITRSQEQLHSIKDLSMQVQQALAELDEQ